MRISDWSSDVCSSDLSRALLRNSLFKTFLDQRIDEEPGAVVARLFLRPDHRLQVRHPLEADHQRFGREGIELLDPHDGGRLVASRIPRFGEIGRASGRERGGQSCGSRWWRYT